MSVKVLTFNSLEEFVGESCNLSTQCVVATDESDPGSIIIIKSIPFIVAVAVCEMVKGDKTHFSSTSDKLMVIVVIPSDPFWDTLSDFVYADGGGLSKNVHNGDNGGTLTSVIMFGFVIRNFHQYYLDQKMGLTHLM